MKKLTVLFVSVFAIVMMSGCSALNTAANGVKDKNIAMGSDTWGGEVVASFVSAESPLPNLSIWFGRRKTWYTSIKDGNDVKVIPEIVKASNTPLNVTAGAAGLGVTQNDQGK